MIRYCYLNHFGVKFEPHCLELKRGGNALKRIPEIFNLKGKVAVVTGAGMGIGRGIAIRLAEAGASIMIADINPEAANKTTAEIKENGGIASYIQADTSQIDSAAKVIRFVLEFYGDIHILVNNAGIYRLASALEVTEELWDKTIDINLKGVMFYSREAARAMISKGHEGKIINIASIDAFKPTGNLVHYDASKGGVVMLTRGMAKELAPYGILVNAIAPGGINTPGTAALAHTTRATQSQAEEKSFINDLPLGHMGDPDDIALAALYLASSASDYIVGHTLVVDGGALLI
jgi:2-deoxy-D-gluconate 3-dehydrogenase